MSEGLEVARLFLADSVPIVLTQSKAMAADPPRALSTAATRLPLTGGVEWGLLVPVCGTALRAEGRC